MLKLLHTAARIVLGLIYFIFGGMGLMIALGFITPQMPPMSAGAEAFFKGIMMSGYFFPLLKATETICGFLLLINCASPLMLVILAPITLHIAFYHAFLTPGADQLFLPIAMVLFQIIAMVGYTKQYRNLLSS